MQLFVACNLILEGVRMLNGRWIFSHRRCWIMIYVLCCNAQIKSQSNHLVMYWSIFYQLPNCNLFTQQAISLWRDNSSELWIPVLFPLLRNSAAILLCLIFANISFHSIRLILCVQQTGEIDNLTASWGKVLWLCCVQVACCCWYGSASCH